MKFGLKKEAVRVFIVGTISCVAYAILLQISRGTRTHYSATKVCFSFSTGGTQHSIPVLVLSRMFATQCSHDPLVADYVDIILFDAQFSKASEENYPR